MRVAENREALDRAVDFGSEENLCCRYTMGGRHEGEFMGVGPTGREISLDGITVLRFESGRCVERWSRADMLGLFVQLGAVSPPG
jgi:predicted ester cyclase